MAILAMFSATVNTQCKKLRFVLFHKSLLFLPASHVTSVDAISLLPQFRRATSVVLI